MFAENKIALIKKNHVYSNLRRAHSSWFNIKSFEVRVLTTSNEVSSKRQEIN